jgi:hypothetical protein
MNLVVRFPFPPNIGKCIDVALQRIFQSTHMVDVVLGIRWTHRLYLPGFVLARNSSAV